MWEFVNRLDWTVLIIVAVFLALAPFRPEPHLVEKLRMLAKGTLRRPIDIFDLLFHAAPLVLILLKIIASGRR